MFEVSKFQEKKRKNQVEMQNKNFRDKSNNSLTDSKSQKIHEVIKTKVFRKIFSMLDVRSQNQIDGNTIDITVLPERIKKIIEPLIMELRDQNETLTGEEFLLACEHLYKVMPVSEKNTLFQYYSDKDNKSRERSKKRNPKNNFTFRVKITF